MRFLKEKKGLIISFIIGVIIASSITVYATSYFAMDISYTKPGTETAINVETALNELYSKSNKTPQQVATINTPNASYTFQNDGYISGTANRDSTNSMAKLFLGSKELVLSNWDEDKNYDVSVYVTSGTIVRTRSDGGTYNLICYEFK